MKQNQEVNISLAAQSESINSTDSYAYELKVGQVYTVKRYPKDEGVIVRQCQYYGFDLGKHVFTTVDDGYLYPPKVITVSPSRLATRVSAGWKPIL